MRRIYAISTIFIGNLCAQIGGSFTVDFNRWLIERYGLDVQVTLNRGDLGEAGSFGGKTFRSERLRNQPVIFVHGVSDRAHDKPISAARENGYEWSELYGTTYANGAEGNPLQWTQYAMRCSYVKQNLVGTGKCVDTGEDLGRPLTRFIDSFVGIAGPNHGISLQVGGVSIPGCAFSVLPVCNTQTGLYSGMCPTESAYLQVRNFSSYLK
uniref:Uncharacterized protein n=1 Tax=Parascaris equorum TaxID=6256 RepID=A0A914RT95_PAREQ